MKRTITALFIVFNLIVTAQIPPGYYNSAQGLYGDDLKLALYNIIKNHSQQNYSDLWTAFNSTDQQSNGSVWDIYSTNSSGGSPYTYSFGADQCGNYNSEGDCYNREHSMPKSWYNDAYPMYSDLFHIYPTDGYVNNKRSNYPYGTVGSASWTSQNGSKVGSSNYPGYSGTVFEPVDEYKGDVARSYFYMMTRYTNVVSGWSSDMLSGNDLTGWAENMLLDWHLNDPVSQKEIDRNNAIYAIQNNRNPFIDEPFWVQSIWGPIADIQEQQELQISAWYANQQLTIDNPNQVSGQLKVVNMLGEELLNEKLNEAKSNVAFSFPSGIYIASFSSNVGVKTIKFFVN